MGNLEKLNEQYYDEVSKNYSDETLSLDMTQLYLPFLENIPDGGKILDAGCGPGRDSKYFLNKGYEVDAFDLSNEMVKLASEYTGIKVQKKSFTEIDYVDIYDGIWCCASLLHIPSDQLRDVLTYLVAGLKKNGVLYASFKLRIFEGIRNGRFFNDMNQEKLSGYTPDTAKIINSWETQDVRKGRSGEYWLNVILKKH